MDKSTQNWEQMTYPFFNLNLNYALNSLEPFIDSKTMHLHYELLLENYIKNLNQLLETKFELQNLTLTELINFAKENQEIELLQQAGGVYNHFFYFTEIRPATGQIVIGITPQATQKITATFGGWKSFKEEFARKALSVFGSGYAWLVKNTENNLEIVTTTNQNVPLNKAPILCIDVWEHAYIFKYLNQRQAYIEAFWNVVDWVKFCEKI